MAKEIERKFLVRDQSWQAAAGPGKHYRQGYVACDSMLTVRVRTDGAQAWLTIKSRPVGLTRDEFEYPIPLADAALMLDSYCDTLIVEKRRYCVRDGGTVWEIDVFLNENQGLVLAEVELDHEQQTFSLPDWLGEEVTHDRRYCNSYLARQPFTRWPEAGT